MLYETKSVTVVQSEALSASSNFVSSSNVLPGTRLGEIPRAAREIVSAWLVDQLKQIQNTKMRRVKVLAHLKLYLIKSSEDICYGETAVRSKVEGTPCAPSSVWAEMERQ